MSSDLFLAQFEKGEIINSNSLMASRSFVGKDLYFGDTSNISNNILPISATHGRGISQLINDLSERLFDFESSEDFALSSTRIAIIGRPNV